MIAAAAPVIFAAVASLAAAAHGDDLLPALTGDDVLDALDDAFWYLRHDDHGHARWSLEKATRRFDDLALDGSSLEKAFASDGKKPYRGRPHERVLAEALLAALDVERGRCDLALPALKQAAFLDAKQQKSDVSDAVLVHALTVRCLARDDKHALGTADDLERARADLAASAGDRAADVEKAIRADDAVLVFDGIGPAFRLDDADHARVVVVPSRDAATSAAVQAATPKKSGAAVIFLGRKSDAALKRVKQQSGLSLWSSTFQASTVQGRPFEQVLRERAQMKAQNTNDGRARMEQAYANARATPPTTSGARGRTVANAAAARLAGSALLFATGAGESALGAATDADADDRFVDGVFERAILVAP